MFEVKALKETLGQIVAEQKEISDLVTRDARVMTDDEISQFDSLEARKSECEKQIKTAERMAKVSNVNAPAVIVRSNKPTKRDHDLALRAFLLNNPETEHMVKPEWRDAAERCNVSISGDRLVLRTDLGQDLGTTGQGIELTDGSIFQQLETRLKAYQGIMEVSRQVTTANGNPIHWAYSDDTANLASIVGENTVVTSVPQTFSKVTLGAYTYRSGAYPVSYELIQDAMIDLTAELSAALATRLGRRMSSDYTVGDGSAKPKGLLTSSTTGVTTASSTAITYAELNNLYHSVDPLYRNNAVWMMHDLTLSYLEQNLKDNNNRPLFVGVGTFGNYSGATPETLLGKRIVINNSMPVMAAGAPAVLFGDCSKFVIRHVAGPTITVLRERWADQAAIGVLAFARGDCGLLDVNAVANLTMKASS